MQTPGFFRNAQQWFFRTPERALNQAYEAAQMIEAMEREYFGGNPIAARYGTYGDSAMEYFQAELKKYLNLIKVRMAEFRASRTVIRVSDPRVMEVDVSATEADELSVNVVDRQAILFRKLRLIDEVLARYAVLETPPERVITLSEGTNGSLAPAQATQVLRAKADQSRGQANGADDPKDNREGLSTRVNVLPRSILRTVDRIRQDLDPNAEEEVVQEFRTSKGRTTAAIRFLLLLVIVPLLTQQFTKNFIVGPVVDHFRQDRQADVFLNIEMEEEALGELQRFEERLRFEVLIGKAPPLSELNIERQVREKATEIEEEYRQRSADAIKNIFADIAAAVAFALLLITRKQDLSLIHI